MQMSGGSSVQERLRELGGSNTVQNTSTAYGLQHTNCATTSSQHA